MARILAVDWGERRIGLAISDPTGTIASGLDTLEVRSESDAVARVLAAATRAEAAAILVGLPLLLSGERGAAALAAERFATRLRTEGSLPVDTFDERLTSAISQRRMREVGDRASRKKARVDQGAAIALLETWLQLLAVRARDAAAPPRKGEA